MGDAATYNALVRIRELWNKPEAWLGYCAWRDADAQEAWTLRDAVFHVTDERTAADVWSRLMAYAHKALGNYDLVAFNDAPYRTYYQMLRFVDRAMEYFKPKEREHDYPA